ncbi:MAG: bacterioferritin [bacterium]
MDKEKIVEGLNRALERELSVITQYFWHHVMAKGIESQAVKGIFKGISITEMKHAEMLAERIDFLGGTPTTKPREIKVGGDLKSMIAADVKAEEEAVDLYKELIETCKEDIVTRRMLEGILADEEEHLSQFSSLLE